MKTLQEAVKEKEPILFIGAGFSKCLGLPDWKGLVFDILDLCEEDEEVRSANKVLLNKGRSGLLEMIDSYEKNKSEIYSNIIKEKLKIEEDNNGLLRFQKLWKISDKIITTNYDKALEITGNSSKEVIENNADFELARLQNSKNYILNLHGSIDNVQSCVLFTSDYNKIYEGDTLVKKVFENIIQNNILVFIGFSMTDPYVNNIFSKINSIYSGYLDKHYIITTENQNDFSRYNLQPHNITDWGNGLDKLLDDLIAIRQNKETEPIIIEKTVEVEKTEFIVKGPINKLNSYPILSKLFTGRESHIEEFKKSIINYRIFAIEGLGGFGKTEFASKCIEECIVQKDSVVWLNGNEDSKFDIFIEEMGYGEMLKNEKNTQLAIYSGLVSLIERDKRILFLDNFQAIKSIQFQEFLNFAASYLKESTIVIISKSEVYINGTSPHNITIKGLENALEYAIKIRDSEPKFNKITNDELALLVKNTMEHPLAIKLSIPLLEKGIKATDLINKIAEYQGKGLKEVEELTKRIFEEVYHHNSTSNEEKVLLQNIAVFKDAVSKTVIDLILEQDNFVELSKLTDKFLVNKDGDLYSLHPLIKELSYKLLNTKIESNKKVADYFLKQRSEKLDILQEENIFYHLGKSEQWNKINEEIEFIGEDLMIKGHYEIIKEFIVKLRNATIENPRFNIFLGEIEELKGSYAIANAYYELAANQEVNKEIRAEGFLKLGGISFMKGLVIDAKKSFEAVLEVSTKSLYNKIKSTALDNLGITYQALGKYNEAIQFHEESLKTSKAIEYQQGIAASLGNLGTIYQNQGKYNEAIRFHQNSLIIERKIGHQQGIAASLGSLGNIYKDLGKYNEAIQFHQESLSIEREIGHQQGIAASLGNLGAIYQDQGKYNEAIQFHYESLKISKEVGHRQSIAASLGNLGTIYQNQGKYNEAIRFHQESLFIEREIGHQQGIAAVLGSLGGIYHALGEYNKSIQFYQDSLIINKKIGYQQGIAASLGNLGDIYQALGKYNEAIQFHQESLSIEREIGHQQGIASSLGSLGAIYQDQGKYNEAIQLHQESLEIRKEIGHQKGIASSLGNLGNVYQKQGEYDEAIKFIQDSLVIEREIGHQQGIAASLGSLGVIYQRLGKCDEAINFQQESLTIEKEIGHQQGIAASLHNLGTVYTHKQYFNGELAIGYFFKSLIILKKINLPNIATLSWLNDLRDKVLKKEKFRELAYKVHNTLSEDDKELIDIRNICRESMQSKEPSLNEPCPCGSGKKYKRCHGKK